MCIADCLQCSLGLVWGEWSHEHCRSMCVCLCVRVQTVVSCLSSLCLHWSSSTFEHRIIEINKSAQSHQKKRSELPNSNQRNKSKNLADTQAAFYLILVSPLTSSVMLRLQCPRVPDSSSHRDMFGLHKADDY